MRPKNELGYANNFWGIPDNNPFIYENDDLIDALRGDPEIDNDGDSAFQLAEDANTLGERPIADVPVIIGQSVYDATIPVNVTDALVVQLQRMSSEGVMYCKRHINDDDPANHNKILNKMFDDTNPFDMRDEQGELCLNGYDFLIEYNLHIGDH